jgi:hypothetical protein
MDDPYDYKTSRSSNPKGLNPSSLLISTTSGEVQNEEHLMNKDFYGDIKDL